MTTATERAYFEWHTRARLTGDGAIVDLGPWLGSTTVALAMGLRESRRPATRGARIHAFDRFIWENWMDAYAGLTRIGTYSPGDSFLPEFEEAVRPWSDLIEVHAGDLCEQRWDDGPIALLLVDAMKSWELCTAITGGFFGAMAPGHGHVIHQDFGHCYTPWIHLVGYRLRAHLVPVVDVPHSETVVFRVTRPFELSGNDAELRREAFDDAEIAAAFAYSLQIARPEKHSGIHAANVMLHVFDGDLERAAALADRLARDGRLSAFHRGAVAGALTDARGGKV